MLSLCLQVLILPNFHDFPSDAITVEFWMNSIDTCRPGVPFSYAHGEYEKQDNSFLIFNYNSFGVSVCWGWFGGGLRHAGFYAGWSFRVLRRAMLVDVGCQAQL